MNILTKNVYVVPKTVLKINLQDDKFILIGDKVISLVVDLGPTNTLNNEENPKTIDIDPNTSSEDHLSSTLDIESAKFIIRENLVSLLLRYFKESIRVALRGNLSGKSITPKTKKHGVRYDDLIVLSRDEEYCMKISGSHDFNNAKSIFNLSVGRKISDGDNYNDMDCDEDDDSYNIFDNYEPFFDCDFASGDVDILNMRDTDDFFSKFIKAVPNIVTTEVNL